MHPVMLAGMRSSKWNRVLLATALTVSTLAFGALGLSINGAFDDGLAGAPSGATIQFTTLLDIYHAVGQADGRNKSSAHQPPWNVAGVDYPVGPHVGTVFKDVVTATMPAGVSRSIASKTLTLTSNNVTLDSWDLKDYQINVPGGISNTTITNSNWDATITHPLVFGTGNGLTVRYCQANGNSITDFFMDWRGPGFVIVEYNYIHHVAGDFFSIAAGSDATLYSYLAQYNVLEDNSMIPGHPDYLQQGGGVFTSFIVRCNTCVQHGSPVGTQGFIPEDFDTGAIIHIDNNVMIARHPSILMISRWIWLTSESSPASPSSTVANNFVDLSSAARFRDIGAGCPVIWTDQTEMNAGTQFDQVYVP